MIVMDTHIWLWWVTGNLDLLGLKRVQLLEQPKPLAVSAISCFEVRGWITISESSFLKTKQSGLPKPLQAQIFYCCQLSQK